MLWCVETLTDSSTESRKLLALNIYRLADQTTQKGKIWNQLATVMQDSPQTDTVSNARHVSAELFHTKGELKVELTRPEECQSTQYSCVAEMVDKQGHVTLKKSVLGGRIGSDAALRLDNVEVTKFIPSYNLVSALEEIDYHNAGGRLDEKLDDFYAKIMDKIEKDAGEKIAKVTNLVARLQTSLGNQVESVATKFENLIDLNNKLATEVGSLSNACMSKIPAPVDEYFDVLGTGRKEWRLAFKGVAYNNVPIYPAYIHGTGIPSEVEDGCKQFNYSLPCANHYRNKDALENWQNVDEVLFAIYVKGQMSGYFRWDAGQPKQPTIAKANRCVYIATNSYWRLTWCHEFKDYVCQTSNLAITY
ncbi:hypothetical protein PoB_006406400, partial [Plakobranchus ocellatus]